MIKHSPLTFIPDGVNKATNLDTDDNSSIEDILTAADTETTQSQGQTVKGKEDAQHNIENVEERDVKNEQKLEQRVQEEENGLQHDQKTLLNQSLQRDRKCWGDSEEQQRATYSNTNMTKEETVAKVHALQDSMKLLRDMLTSKRPIGAESSGQIDKIDGSERQSNSAFIRGLESSQKESPALYKKQSHLKDMTFQERLHLLQCSQNSFASSSDKPSSTTSNSESVSESNRQCDANVANVNLRHKINKTSIEEIQEIDKSSPPSKTTSECPEEVEQSVKPKRIPPPTKPKPRIRTSSCPLPASGSTSPGTTPPPTPPRSADSIGRRHFWLPRPEEEKPEIRCVEMPSARRKGKKTPLDPADKQRHLRDIPFEILRGAEWKLKYMGGVREKIKI